MSEMSDREHHLLEQISLNLAAITAQLAALDQVQRHTLERLVRLEERQSNAAKVDERIDKVESILHERISSHSDRITTLEARGHRLDGASNAVEWANKLWPLFAATIGLIGIYLGLIRP